MNIIWLLVAIWAPLLWAFSNHIDKYLITKYGSAVGIRGVVTFSALFSSVISAVALYFSVGLFSMSTVSMIKLYISGILGIFAVLYYVKALSHDEASVVAPVFQMIPVIAFILGYIFLGESLNNSQMLGGLIVMSGAIFISTELKDLKFNKKVFLLTFFSSILFAVYQLLFKSGASDNFWNSIFWQSLGSFTVGLYFLLNKKYRDDFKLIFKSNSKKIIFWSLLVELTTACGNLLISMAIILAPSVALVLLVESFQPICVFLLGIVFTVFIPSFAKESIDKKTLIKKILAIAVIITGSYILYF